MGIWLAIISYFLLVIVFKNMVKYWWKPRAIQLHFRKQGIRGPKYRLFFGNMKELASLSMRASFPTPTPTPTHLSHNILPTVLSFYHHWKEKYGAIFVIWFGVKARVAISDPVLIREILSVKADYFEKVESPALVRKLEGAGLVSLHGDIWAYHRSIIMPTFHLQNLKKMMPKMVSSAEKMMEEWRKICWKDGKVEIEVCKCFQKLAEEVIIYTAFGGDSILYEEEEEDGRTIFQLQAQQMVHATEAYLTVFIPGYRFLPTKTNILAWKLDKKIRQYLMKLILERVENSTHLRRSDECPRPYNLVELMINASLKQTTNESTTKDTSSSSATSMITCRDMVEECKTMLFAGKHTTSNLMTWTIVLLAMHPSWQKLAREEVYGFCGARDTPTKNDLGKLKTLGMILNESLRLYPPAVALIRQAKFDVQLGGLNIPQGTELLIPILAVHHDPELWGNDSNDFNPLRFANDVDHVHVANQQPMAFFPFGRGSRRCIGQNLALFQAKLALAMILQRFSFELSPNYQHAPIVQMLLCPQYGAPVIFQTL